VDEITEWIDLTAFRLRRRARCRPRTFNGASPRLAVHHYGAQAVRTASKISIRNTISREGLAWLDAQSLAVYAKNFAPWTNMVRLHRWKAFQKIGLTQELKMPARGFFTS